MTGSTANGPGETGTEFGANARDECPWCRTADPSVGETCKNCGRPIAAATDVDPSPAPTSWAPPPPPPAVTPRPPVVVPVVAPIVTARPSGTSEFQLLEAEDEMGPSRSWVMLGWLAVAAATIGVLAIVLLSGDSDGGATPDTLPPVVSTSSVPEGATTAPPAATTAPTSAPAPLPTPIPTTISSAATSPATAVPVTNPLTTTPPATAAPQTPPPATAPPPSTAPPATAPPATSPATSDPAPPPPSGPGSPLVLNDPLPSGVTTQAVAPAFALGQRLADALAGGDWDTVRAIDVDSRQTTDESFQAGYGGLDQASLMLLDAKAEGDGYRLLVVSVAVELGGSRTSLYCLEWSSDPDAGAIDQHGGAIGLVARVARPMSPEEVRQDASLEGEMHTECVWSS